VVFIVTAARVIGLGGWSGFCGIGWVFVMLFVVFCGQLAGVWEGRFMNPPGNLLT